MNIIIAKTAEEFDAKAAAIVARQIIDKPD